jgi:hypothetical protein
LNESCKKYRSLTCKLFMESSVVEGMFPIYI